VNNIEKVCEALAGVVSQDIFFTRQEAEPEPPVAKIYRLWIAPQGQPSFPIPVEAMSLHEARELATKAARVLPQVGGRSFTVSGRMA
jgi:hypothetical protein